MPEAAPHAAAEAAATAYADVITGLADTLVRLAVRIRTSTVGADRHDLLPDHTAHAETVAAELLSLVSARVPNLMYRASVADRAARADT